MKKLLFLVPIFLIKSGFSQTNDYNIKAEIDGIGNDTCYLIYYPLTNINAEQKDTIVANGNILIYKLPITEPAAVAIIPQKSFYKRISGGLYVPQTKFIELIISPNDKIEIRGTLNKYYLNYIIAGTKINEKNSQIRLSYKAQSIEAVKLELQIDSLSGNENKKDELTRLFELRNLKFNEIKNIKLQFIKQNTDNDLSAYYLRLMPLDTFAVYYPKLTGKVRDGIFSEVLKSQYVRYQKFIAAKEAEQELIEGKQAPDFSLKDKNGSIVTLSALKGKYIVLDFWGSWCGWCIEEFPSLKTYYENHKTEIEFVGIACNDSAEAWQNAIEKNQLIWTQLFNSDDNDVSVLYGVKAFPTKIILDKDLKIIKRFVGTDEDFYQTLKGLLKK